MNGVFWTSLRWSDDVDPAAPKARDLAVHGSGRDRIADLSGGRGALRDKQPEDAGTNGVICGSGHRHRRHGRQSNAAVQTAMKIGQRSRVIVINVRLITPSSPRRPAL